MYSNNSCKSCTLNCFTDWLPVSVYSTQHGIWTIGSPWFRLPHKSSHYKAQDATITAAIWRLECRRALTTIWPCSRVLLRGGGCHQYSDAVLAHFVGWATVCELWHIIVLEGTAVCCKYEYSAQIHSQVAAHCSGGVTNSAMAVTRHPNLHAIFGVGFRLLLLPVRSLVNGTGNNDQPE